MTKEDESKPPRSFQGPAFAVFLIFLVLVSVWFFTQRRWWMPEVASIHGMSMDRVFGITLMISGVLFILAQTSLAWLVVRYRAKSGERASAGLRRGMEKRFAMIGGGIILAVDLTIFMLGETEWFKAWGAPPEDAMVVEVTGEQFMWNFRYPGPDGVFGRTDPRLVTGINTLGLDREDPAAVDDVVSINQLHLPVGEPVRLRIRSKDVIHSFFLPHQRVKQDAVPGMHVEWTFTPAVAADFEIACAQLCGLGHYRMRAMLTVESAEQFREWLELTAEGGY